jgi:hypothetical protein
MWGAWRTCLFCCRFAGPKNKRLRNEKHERASAVCFVARFTVPKAHRAESDGERVCVCRENPSV